MVFRQEIDGPLEHRFVVVVESEDDTRIHHDAVFMEHFDLFRKLLDAIERFVGFIQTVFVERFHPHEYRDTAAFGSQLDHLLVVTQKQRGLASPLELEGLERCPELTAVGPVAVVQVVDESHDAAVFDAHSDLHGRQEGAPQRFIADAFDQFASNPPLHVR